MMVNVTSKHVAEIQRNVCNEYTGCFRKGIVNILGGGSMDCSE